MYNPQIKLGYEMYERLFNLHKDELFWIELKYDLLKYKVGGELIEQPVPNVFAEFKR